MIKEPVLKIEHEKVFDKYAVRIVYQNDNILERENFDDCGVRSITCIEYKNNVFYIRGSNAEKDDKIIIVDDNQLQDIFEKVNKVNEKYGVIKRDRVNKDEYYYYIDAYGDVCVEQEACDWRANLKYDLGNYFRTKDEARRVLDSIQWKTLWNDIKENRLTFGV